MPEHVRDHEAEPTSTPSGGGPAKGNPPSGSPSASASSRRRLPLALLALGLLLIAVAAGLWLWQGASDDGMEPNVVVGPMGSYTDEELAAMLAQKVDEGTIAFSINTQVVVAGPEAPAPLLFENPANNAKLLKLALTRDDTGELVYETGYLSPGTYVGEDVLDVRLEPGTYVCTATISSFSEAEKKPLGQAAAEVTVIMQENESEAGLK